MEDFVVPLSVFYKPFSIQKILNNPIIHSGEYMVISGMWTNVPVALLQRIVHDKSSDHDLASDNQVMGSIKEKIKSKKRNEPPQEFKGWLGQLPHS